MRRAACPIALLLLAACTTSHYEARADRTAYRLIDAGVSSTLGGREQRVRHPERLEPAEAEPPAPPDVGQVQEGVRRISLADALEIAVTTSRDYQTQREALYLAALSLYDARHAFSTLTSATLAYLFSDSSGGSWTHDASFDASLSRVLHHGGTLTADATTTLADGEAVGATYTTSATVRLSQPLLRGSGHEVSHESLVQSERNLIYALRNFELFREDFSIDVATRFYDLVQQQQSLENLQTDLDSNAFSRKQAEALFEVGRSSELDVLRARRSELNAQNTLIAAEEDYQLALDRFKIFLGLSPDERLDVEREVPEFVPVDFDPSSAVEVALENRLDVITRKEQLDDSQRAVRIARDQLRSDLDLDLTGGLSGTPATTLLSGSYSSSLTAGLTLGLPTDRVNEQNAWMSSRLAHAQALRDFEQFEDDLVVEIESAFRELERRQQSLEIQQELIHDQERNLKIARIRFERGEVSNRDVVEAQESLTEARNSLVREQVAYEIARLRLLRNLGILFIDERGMWKET